MAKELHFTGPRVRAAGLTALLVTAALGGELEFKGDSMISMNGAELRTHCIGDEKAEWKFQSVATASATTNESALTLRNVPASCLHSAIEQPCADSNANYPKLFKCSYSSQFSLPQAWVKATPNVMSLFDAQSSKAQWQYRLEKQASYPASCWALLQAGKTTSGKYTIYPRGASKAGVEVYCDQQTNGGGWARVFKNDLKKNHDGLDFEVSCTCSHGNSNEGSNAKNGDGWLVGVTGCQGQNKQVTVVSGAAASTAWTIDPSGWPNVGKVSTIRHTAVTADNRGFDHTNLQTGLTDTSPLKSNGEFGSAYKDGNGNWKWFAEYGLGTWDVKRTSSNGITYPYFKMLHSDGGPGDCDVNNADGFRMKDWTIWVK